MITITVSPAMAEQIREFCVAQKAFHQREMHQALKYHDQRRVEIVERYSAAVIELDNLATSLCSSGVVS